MLDYQQHERFGVHYLRPISVLDKVLQEEFEVKLLALWPGDPQVVYCRGGRDERIGVSSNTLADFAAAIEAQPVRMGANQAYEALARDEIDCAIGGAFFGNQARWYEVTDILFDFPISLDFRVRLVNLSVWNQLDNETQKLLEENFQEMEAAFWRIAPELVQINIECSIGEASACGTGNLGTMALEASTEEDLAGFRQILQKTVIPRWVSRCGIECANVFNHTIAPVIGIKARPEPVPVPAGTPIPTPTPRTAPTATSYPLTLIDSGLIGLKLGAVMSGRVIDAETGLPVADVEVYGGPVEEGYLAWTRTDSNGVYILMGLPDGVIEVVVSGQGYIEERRFVTILGGVEVTGVDF